MYLRAVTSQREEEGYMGRWGGPGGGGTSIIKNPLKGLRIFPKIQINGPINYRLVSFVLEMIPGEFFPLVLSDHSIRRLRSLVFLAWRIRASIGST